MFLVPRIAMPHLIAALKAEIGQEQDMIAWIMSDDADDDWPDGYDPNDLPLFDIILRTLVEADSRQLEEIDIDGKPLTFMVWPLPEYLRIQGATLTFEERHALDGVLDRYSIVRDEWRKKYSR
jgi:hypothetical protein